MKPLELWGGHECSVVRVHDSYHDQNLMSGHQNRLSDLKDFAGLGLKSLRYPVLWERIAPDSPDTLDFTWTDERLAEIRRLGMKPIVGLLHHGSGPRYTSLIDKDFPSKFAAYARAVAERYPWVDDWNPVNEPLTTARFSLLYGAWFPHRVRAEGPFWLALLNEVNAARLAMREIRKVNPAARLIQTEDLGFAHATPPLAAEAEFENQRRWITWDLLCGRVVPGHPLWSRIAGFGLHKHLDALAADPCPPDVLGTNYYASSERFLDHEIDPYPEKLQGHDIREKYINVDAVRSIERGPLGLAALITQAWERYGIPISITETHNVGTRDEQMRWVVETWMTCQALRREGVAIEAVTAWSLIGAFDWKILGVRDSRRYEVGIFDLCGGYPRPTAIAPVLRALARGEDAPPTIALTSPGWWRRDVRFEHDTEGRQRKHVVDLIDPGPFHPMPPPFLQPHAPILLIGSTGMVGAALLRACQRRGLPVVPCERTTLRLEDPASIRDTIEKLSPSAVINAAGYFRVDAAEDHPNLCFAANTQGPQNLAHACKLADLPLITLSSDMVFDGSKGSYVEADETCPINTYGRSRAEGERRLVATGGRNLIIRTSALFSPDDTSGFAIRMLNDLAEGLPLHLASDCFFSPTYLPDLVDALLDLLIDGETGIWHLVNAGRMSWADFARTLAEHAGFDPGGIYPVPVSQLHLRAPRPRDISLSSARGILLSESATCFDRFLADTRNAPHKLTPQPTADLRDPVLIAAGTERHPTGLA